MTTFQVNNTDSAHVMLDKLNSYVATIKKEKYNNILKLLNELLEKKYNTLRNFVGIDCEYFETQSMKKIMKILETHKPKFNYDTDKLKKHYNENKKKDSDTIQPTKSTKQIEHDIENHLEHDMENHREQLVEIKTKSGSKSGSKTEEFSVSKEIFSIISKLLKTIEYKLVKSRKGTKQCYSILMC